MTLLAAKLLRILTRWMFKAVVVLGMLFFVFLLINAAYPRVRSAIQAVEQRDRDRDELETQIEKADKDQSELENLIERKLSLVEIADDKINALVESFDAAAHKKLKTVNANIKALEAEGRPWAYVSAIWGNPRSLYDAKMKGLKGTRVSLQGGIAMLSDDDPTKLKWIKLNQGKSSEAANLSTVKGKLKLNEKLKNELNLELGYLTGSTNWLEELRGNWQAFQSWIVPVLAVIFFGPLLWGLSVYYGLCRVIARQAPIVMANAESTSVCWSPPASSHVVRISPGEKFFVRGDLLTQYDQGIRKRTALLWNWKAPAVSIISGLVCCTESINDSESLVSATLSSSDAEMEISEVVLEEGSQLVLHPHCLIAIQGPVTVRVAWHLLSPSAWLTSQLRYIIFCGPGSIYLIASRGIEGCEIGRGTNPAVTTGIRTIIDCWFRRKTWLCRSPHRNVSSLFVGEGILV